MARRTGRSRYGRERIIRFALWAVGLGRVPTPGEIATKFGISLDFARVWRRDWLAARGPEVSPR